MVRIEGVGSLFKGVLAPVMGLAGLNAILFVSYGGILRYLNRDNLTHPASLSQVYLAGCGAGMACYLFSTPTDLIKIQAQMSRTNKTTYQVAKDIFRRNGLRGFYQGGWITLIRDAPSYGIYFWVYEGMKRYLTEQHNDNVGMAAWELLLAGGMAGTISWASIYPIDVIKSRLQMQQVSPLGTTTTPLIVLDQPYISIKDCVVRSYRSEGVGVFFRGLGPTVLRGFPVNAVTFLMYEWVMAWLDAHQQHQQQLQLQLHLHSI
ncbi:mitochondrial carrier domain-containing protein [Chlamydoabsidia padenii]|nr:mitochondrial carrier domain-containing protein [Chlamydoabsidia padenii]